MAHLGGGGGGKALLSMKSSAEKECKAAKRLNVQIWNGISVTTETQLKLLNYFLTLLHNKQNPGKQSSPWYPRIKADLFP